MPDNRDRNRDMVGAMIDALDGPITRANRDARLNVPVARMDRAPGVRVAQAVIRAPQVRQDPRPNNDLRYRNVAIREDGTVNERTIQRLKHLRKRVRNNAEQDQLGESFESAEALLQHNLTLSTTEIGHDILNAAREFIDARHRLLRVLDRAENYEPPQEQVMPVEVEPEPENIGFRIQYDYVPNSENTGDAIETVLTDLPPIGTRIIIDDAYDAVNTVLGGTPEIIRETMTQEVPMERNQILINEARMRIVKRNRLHTQETVVKNRSTLERFNLKLNDWARDAIEWLLKKSRNRDRRN